MRHFYVFALLLVSSMQPAIAVAATPGVARPATPRLKQQVPAQSEIPTPLPPAAGLETQCAKVLRSDTRGVTLAFDFPEPVLSEVPSTGSQLVTVPGCILRDEPGYPNLPELRVMCGVAQEGDIRVTVSGGEWHELAGVDVVPGLSYVHDLQQYVRSDVYAQDRWLPEFDAGRRPRIQNPKSQIQNPESPDEPWVAVEGVEMLHDVRVARLLVSPVRYNPAQQRLRVWRHFVVDIAFAVPARNHRDAVRANPDPFEKLYPLMLVNGATAGAWKAPQNPESEIQSPKSAAGRRTDDAASLSSGGSFFDRSPVWIKIEVETTGVYRIGYRDLAACGVNPDFIDPRTFQLFTCFEQPANSPYPDSMKEIALYAGVANDSSFRQSDYLLFYGRAISDWDSLRRTFVMNPYSCYNVYWLTWGNARGKRMMSGLGRPEAGAPRRVTGLARAHLEQDLDCPARCGLLWVWDEMNKSDGTESLTTKVSLDLPHPSCFKRLVGCCYSTSADNRMNVVLNGQSLDSCQFGIQSYIDPFEFELDYDSLPPGPASDTLALVLRGSGAMQVYLDWLEVTYAKRLALDERGALDFYVAESSAQTYRVSGVQGEPLILNVDNRDAPHVITGALHQADTAVFRDVVSDTAYYFVTDFNHLRRPASIERRTPGRLRTLSADYVIVAPEPMYDVAQVLQHYRTGNVPGLSSATARTVKLSEVYDDFTYGRPEPIAIKEFFRTARPAYALLVGDATYDYRDMLGANPPPGVPPYEEGYSADPSGYSASSRAIDAWYADFDGSGSTPDMFLGRITARTPDEFRRFIDKLIRYETGPHGSWCQRGIAAADDEWLGWYDPQYPAHYVDRIGLDHTRDAEIIAALWGEPFTVSKVYETEYPFTGFGDKAGARSELIRQLSLGALFFCYFGHGSGEGLTSENLFNVQLVPQIVNEGRLPLCMFASCAVGRWEDTRFQSIAEELARLPGSGSIASVGASKATQPSSNLDFARNMFRVLLDSTHPTLGQAFAAGVPSLSLYHLFGDPATRIAFADSGGSTLYVADTLQPGRSYPFSATFPFPSGYADVNLSGSLWLRTYNSPAPINQPTVTYILPGDEFYRGVGRITDGILGGRFTVPSGTRRGTRTTSDGSYIEIARTAGLALSARDNEHFLSLQDRKLALDTEAATSADAAGPQITLYADGSRLSPAETTLVAANFTLTGHVSDTSGILLTPLPSGDAFYYYVGDYTKRISLCDRFVYDLGSGTSGSFSAPVEISGGADSIVVSAADNFGNRNAVVAHVRVPTESRLSISEPLVYPNPVKDHSEFTFYLSAAAEVTVRVFTLSGRLVCEMALPNPQPGFNHLAWNGQDRQNAPLPNGVYLYAVTARSYSGQGRADDEATVRDKFIVRR